MKEYRIWDGIQGELIEVDSKEEAVELIKEMHVSGNECHPDILSCLILKVVENPLEN